MFRKARVQDIKDKSITRADGHIAVCMCHYPRGVAKKLIDEYLRALAPDKKLLYDFHTARERLGDHNAAFLSVNYQKRFELGGDAVEHLRRLAELSKTKDVFVVCQCELDQRCHRELLLICAKRWFNAKTELRKFSYPEFEARVPDEPGPIDAKIP